MSLISQRLDNYYQIQTKYYSDATVHFANFTRRVWQLNKTPVELDGHVLVVDRGPTDVSMSVTMSQTVSTSAPLVKARNEKAKDKVEYPKGFGLRWWPSRTNPNVPAPRARTMILGTRPSAMWMSEFYRECRKD